MYWEVGATVDYAIQTLDREMSKFKEGVPRELSHYIKNPQKDGEFWTLQEWLSWREKMENEEPRLDRDAPEGARPPLPEELDAIRKAREARIAEKYREAAEADSVD